MFENDEIQSGNVYVVPDSRQENRFESNVEVYTETSSLDKKPQKPCPPGHYKGKGHYVGDNCNCDGFDTTPSVSIDQTIFYVLLVLIGLAMIITTDKRYQKWIYKIRSKRK